MGGRERSAFARYALGAYVLLILYASLYPFDDWRWQGLSPLAFVAAPLPRYLTFSDLWLNVVGYLPLGWLLAARRRGVRAWLAATIGCATLSFAMEAVQTFLPARVSSNVDWAMNTLGGALGAALAVWLVPRLRISAALRALRQRWFDADASFGLMLLAAWPAALLWPTPAPFATGQIGAPLAQALIRGDAGGWPAWIEALLQPQPLGEQLQTQIGAAMLLAVICGAAALQRPGAPRLRLGAALLLVGAAAASASSWLGFGAAHALDWLTPAALRALALGAGVGLPLTRLPRRGCAALALGALLLALWQLDRVGLDPYYAQSVLAWRDGLFVQMFELPRWIDWLWPYAFVVLLVQRLRVPADARDNAG